ncbi:MAG: amidohydrolase/deacetylase family metallohydrolase [Candidatus Bathyarchaeia archaeon]
MYDLIVKDGSLIDPAQGIEERMDIAVSDGRIAAVETRLPGAAKQVMDAGGLIVTPGLVDIHVHVCHDISYIGVDPEASCLLRGSTTVLDAGSTGHLQFRGFKRYVIDTSKTRIYALLNIESLGMIEYGLREQWPKLIDGLDEVFTRMFVSPRTVETIQRNRDVLLGLKWAHHGLEALRAAREAADEAGCLLMAENHFEPETLRYMKRGDIVTHLYHGLTARPHDGVLDEDGRVQPEFFDAVKRGVVMDVGHGAGSFSWNVAEEALKQGLKPDTISTDLHVNSVNGPAYDMPTTMAKFLHLGFSLEEVVRASTARPAEALGKLGEIGTLKPGACADLVLFKLEEGRFSLSDTKKQLRVAARRLRPMMVVKGGEVYRP